MQQVWRVATPEEVFDALLHATVRTRATPLTQSEDSITRIRAALRKSIAACRREEGYELPMPATLAKGVKPAQLWCPDGMTRHDVTTLPFFRIA